MDGLAPTVCATIHTLFVGLFKFSSHMSQSTMLLIYSLELIYGWTSTYSRATIHPLFVGLFRFSSDMLQSYDVALCSGAYLLVYFDSVGCVCYVPGALLG